MNLIGEIEPVNTKGVNNFDFKKGGFGKLFSTSAPPGGGAVTITSQRVEADASVTEDLSEIFNFRLRCRNSKVKGGCEVQGMSVCVSVMCREESNQAAMLANDSAIAQAEASVIAEKSEQQWQGKTEAESNEMLETLKKQLQEQQEQQQQLMMAQQQGYGVQQGYGMMHPQAYGGLQSQTNGQQVAPHNPQLAGGQAGVQSVTQQFMAQHGGGAVGMGGGAYSAMGASVASAPSSYTMNQAIQQKLGHSGPIGPNPVVTMTSRY